MASDYQRVVMGEHARQAQRERTPDGTPLTVPQVGRGQQRGGRLRPHQRRTIDDLNRALEDWVGV